MLALLLQNGVEGSKSTGKTGASLSVPSDKISLAVTTLYVNGHPAKKFINVNDVFGDSGLVTTDFERKVRFNYALSQEIAETISLVDGVIAVRVHLALVHHDSQLSSLTKVSEEPKLTAAVFIKYNPAYNLESEISQIKLLVDNSVDNLDYRDVSVSLVPARHKGAVEAYVEDLYVVDGLDLKMDHASLKRFYAFISVVALVFVVLICFLVWQFRDRRQAIAPQES